MFSVREKRSIAQQVGDILRATEHPELPATGPIRFKLQVFGAEPWSWANIVNNEDCPTPSVNPHNEAMDREGRD